MSDILFAINATAPIVLMVLVGYFLKRIGLMDATLGKAMNKLVFRVFLPAMLFLNMYKIESFADIDFTFVWYTLGATAVLFGIAIPTVMAMTKENPKRGALLQSVFRANYALVGIPLATSLFGERGSIMATVLSAFIVPLFNMLAVLGLCIFSPDKKPSVKKVLIGIAKNPLIQSIALGFVALGIRAIFVKAGIAFRLTDVEPVYKTLNNLSSVATPLALLVLSLSSRLFPSSKNTSASALRCATSLCPSSDSVRRILSAALRVHTLPPSSRYSAHPSQYPACLWRRKWMPTYPLRVSSLYGARYSRLSAYSSHPTFLRCSASFDVVLFK